MKCLFPVESYDLEVNRHVTVVTNLNLNIPSNVISLHSHFIWVVSWCLVLCALLPPFFPHF